MRVLKIVGVILLGLVILAVIGAIIDPGTTSTTSTVTSNKASTSQSTVARQPRVQDSPTRIPPTPLPSPTPEPEPIYISGFGDTATNAISIPYNVAILTIRHAADGHFALVAYRGEERVLLANVIGRYIGRNWLPSGEYFFDIDAGGMWEITIEPIHHQEWVAEDGMTGFGDDVSGLFMPPSTRAWEVSHTGDGHFAIVAVCAGGRELIANEIGSVSGSTIVRFPKGPCLLKVSANGTFSVKPR